MSFSRFLSACFDGEGIASKKTKERFQTVIQRLTTLKAEFENIDIYNNI
jgi:hypothetical protein